MFLRNGKLEEAEDLVKESLKVHNVTGRLWATLIQIKHSKSQNESDYEAAYKSFLNAVWEIPKSGEIWCEGA